MLAIALSWVFPITAIAWAAPTENSTSTIRIQRSDMLRAVGYFQFEHEPLDENQGVGCSGLKRIALTNSTDEQYDLFDKSHSSEDVERAEALVFEHDVPNWDPSNTGRLDSLLEDRFSNRLLTFWSEPDTQSTRHAIAIWRIHGSTLSLETVLDKAIVAGSQSAYFGDIHRYKKNGFILIGRTAGFDVEGNWGSVWAGLWTLPRSFEIIHRSTFFCGEDCAARMDYRFSPSNLKLKIISRRQKHAFDDPAPLDPEKWETSTETIDLASILRALKK